MRALAIVACLVAVEAGASDFVIQNSNRPFKGFNDRTPVEPSGLNFATTRGGQAQLVFRAAGAIWGATLRSNTPIYVDAAFATQGEDSAFGCKDKNRVVLGFARRTGSMKDPSFPNPDTQYPYALANALAGKSFIGTRASIYTRFNADLGTKPCPVFPWDFSLDENGDTLLSTILHELGHGLGFSSSMIAESGDFFEGTTPFDDLVWDVTTPSPQTWYTSGYERRVELATKPGGTVLSGPAIKRDTPRYLGYQPALRLTLGEADAGLLEFAPGAFSGELVGGGVIAPTDPLDACKDLAKGSLTGKFALIDRGDCLFVEKAARAVDAGAIGIVVANNEAGLVQMAPSSPVLDVPAVMITKAAGATIRTQLTTGTAEVDFILGTKRSNANETGVYLYTPNALEPGSSVSHFNTGSYPRALLMQPASVPSTLLNTDLTASALADMGWSVVNGLTVSVVKALEAPVTQGSEQQYLVVVINRRTTPIDSVNVALTGPGSTSVLSFEGGCTANPCVLTSMRPGATALIIATVKAGAGLTGDFDITATVSPSTADAEDNLTDTTSQPIASGGDLKIAVAGPEKLEPEKDAVFVTTITNAGPSTATEVTAQVTLTAADGSQLTLTGDCTDPATPCVLTQLASGEKWEISTTFAVPKDWKQKATATSTVSSFTPDPDTANNIASSSVDKAGCTATGGEAMVWLALVVAGLVARRRG